MPRSVVALEGPCSQGVFTPPPPCGDTCVIVCVPAAMVTALRTTELQSNYYEAATAVGAVSNCNLGQYLQSQSVLAPCHTVCVCACEFMSKRPCHGISSDPTRHQCHTAPTLQPGPASPPPRP